VPLTQGDQFLLFPSNNLGMGGVSIARADSLLEPFINPATAMRLGGSRLFTSPTVYGTSQGTGAGRSLPFAAFVDAGSWFGGLAVALQQIDATQPGPFFPPPCSNICLAGSGIQGLGTPPPSHGNAYTFASVGHTIPQAHVAVGASMAWSRLRAVDGVAMLYPQSQRVDEAGHTVDLRLGLTKDWTGGRSLQALVMRQGVAMDQNATYIDQIWDPALQQNVQQLRLENNRDRSATWGVDLRYRRPLPDSVWTVGWVVTVNRVLNSQVPDYDVLGIARGAGRSTAADVGVGFSKTQGPGTFAIDMLFEPIASTTWGTAGAPAVNALGDTLPAGTRTLVNRFRFTNGVLRMGVGRQAELPGMGKVAGLQLGLALRAVHYRLTQQDLVQATTQHMDQTWLEWSPTWGLSLRFPELELRYAGRVTNGMGRTNGQQILFPPGVRALDIGLPGFFVTPGGPMVLTGVHTVTHQISLSLPLR
jgi:hypothetical protein